MERTEIFEAERPRLLRVAARVLDDRAEAEATRLEAIGATRAYRVQPDTSTMESGFITMHDPEDNEFCLD